MRKLSAVQPSLSTRAGARRGVDAIGASIPPPIEGWDAISPVAAMSPKRAFRLDNWFPQPSWVELRKGFVTHCDTGSGLPVETLADYQGTDSRQLFAASGPDVYDVTAAGSPSVAISDLANARFQFVNFATTGGNFLWMCNGADDPRYYDGVSWSTAVITGITSTDIVSVNAHKNRLWFVQNNSSDAAYLPTDQIQGAAVPFPLGGIFTNGGRLEAIGTWSVDAGDGPDDYLVFVSSRGQVAIYKGTDPSAAATWSLVGVFNMGAPLGRRCLTRVGSDVAIICIDGVVPLSKVMIFERAAVPKISLTANIQRVMNQSARDYGDHFGWQLMSYPRGTRAILNVPVAENSQQEQYVMNTLNGAWCRFTGMNANCWALLNDIPYFGGNTGTVYQADEGGADEDQTMRADMMTAYNYFGQRGNNKRWMMCRPLLTTDGIVTPGLAFNVDFQTDAAITIPSTQASAVSLWDVALWDVGVWSGTTTTGNWTSVTGLGYCASVRMVVDVSGPTTGLGQIQLQVNGFDLVMQKGAFI